MVKLRKAIYTFSIAGTLMVLFCMWSNAYPKLRPDRHTSAHPSVTMAPLLGFSTDSVVNVGDEKALDMLPGIGEVIAVRILDMRATLGEYRLPEDLLLVKGIGEKTLEKILNAMDESLVLLDELDE